MAKAKGGSNDRDVTFRLGLQPHPDNKRTVDGLKKAITDVDKSISSSGKQASEERQAASKSATEKAIADAKRLAVARTSAHDKEMAQREKARVGLQATSASLLQLGRGFAVLGVLSADSSEAMLRGLVRVQGSFDVIIGTMNSVIEGQRLYRSVIDAASAASDVAKLASLGHTGAMLAEAKAADTASAAHGRLNISRAGASVGGAVGGAGGLLGRGASALAGVGGLGGAAVLGGKVAAAGAVGFGVGQAIRGTAVAAAGGDASGNFAVQGIAKLSEATGVSAQSFFKLTAAVSPFNFSMLGLAKSADELVETRKRLSASEKEREAAEKRKANESIAKTRQSLVGGIETEAFREKLLRSDSMSAEKDKLEARKRFGGDSLQEQIFVSQRVAGRSQTELAQLQNFEGTGAAGDFADERRISLTRRLANNRSSQADMARQFAERNLAPARQEVAGIQNQLGAEGLGGDARRQLQAKLKLKQDVVIRLETDRDEVVRDFLNKSLVLIDRENQLMRTEMQEALDTKLTELNSRSNKDIAARQTANRGF